jgi:hypothetical protein
MTANGAKTRRFHRYWLSASDRHRSAAISVCHIVASIIPAITALTYRLVAGVRVNPDGDRCSIPLGFWDPQQSMGV